jgi:L,D-peptidoglycan transpeptidase YkuD (ErfK/YbiS/YcfS/YnhG family)
MIFFVSLLVFMGFGDIRTDLKTEQLIIVQSKGWNSREGNLTAYEWKSGKWEPVLSDINIVLGKNGLAWGKGLHRDDLNQGTMKKEGDGRSPAGIFRLSGLFSYENIQPKMKSLQVDQQTFCVDDVKSKYYNQIVKADTVIKDWNSAETMRMNSDAYKFGIFVDYNAAQVVPGDGSCIFMHIWSGPGSYTAGCTAMTETDMIKLIDFLDPAKNPLLVQVPKEIYPSLKREYKLP